MLRRELRTRGLLALSGVSETHGRLTLPSVWPFAGRRAFGSGGLFAVPAGFCFQLLRPLL